VAIEKAARAASPIKDYLIRFRLPRDLLVLSL
jgi:hypothetical protein